MREESSLFETVFGLKLKYYCLIKSRATRNSRFSKK